jgi:hypothetical protein
MVQGDVGSSLIRSAGIVLQLKLSAVNCGNETPITKAKRIEICMPNYPIAKCYWELSRLSGGESSILKE